ncbi:hypothetical protein GOODEAATRI_002285, partial [Goodea atripinnis]
DVSVGIKWDSSAVGEQEADVDFDIIPNANDTFTVKYVPPAAGRLTVKVLFTDEEVPQSPFMVKVEPSHDASKVKAKGPGLAPTGVESSKPTHFTVVTKGAGKAPLDLSPSQQAVPCKVEPQPGKADVSLVRYTPKEEGIYTVNVSYDGHPVPGSPFPVEAQLPPDPSKVKAFGPGLKGGLVANPAEFTIDTKGAGTGGLGLTVEGPTEAKIECSDNGDGTCSVSYLPTEPGDYLVNILFENVHIPGSPFRADIQMPFDPSKVVASGSGLKKAKNPDPKESRLYCLNMLSRSSYTTLLYVADMKAKTEVVDNKDGTYTVTYVPLSSGMYTLMLKYGGKAVPGFPAKVMVDPAVDTSKVKVFGPGVEGQVDARPLTRRGGDHVKAEVKNPSGALTECVVTDKADGTYSVEYTPFENGVHRVNVLYDDTPVPRSPFRVSVTEGCDPSRVVATGPGLQQALTDQTNTFNIITRCFRTSDKPAVQSKMSCKDNKDGSCSVEYVPHTPGLYEVNITYGGEHIPGSPFKVPVKDVVDSSKVKVSGPGVVSGVRANIPQSFTVDCRKAGEAPLAVAVTGPKGLAEPVEVIDNGDGTHTVSYTPSVEGPYSVSIKYADEDVPRRVLPTHDASKVRASGPGLTSGVLASFPVQFNIDARDAGQGQLSDQDGKPKQPSIHDNDDGTYTVSYVPDRTGRYTIVIKYGGDDIPASPYRVRATASGDASKCTVTGPGVGPTVAIGEELGLVVNAKGAGKGKVSCVVVQPDGSEVEAAVLENEDGTFDIFYTALAPGNYAIYVRFGGENIPRSPFKVMVNGCSFNTNFSLILKFTHWAAFPSCHRFPFSLSQWDGSTLLTSWNKLQVSGRLCKWCFLTFRGLMFSIALHHWLHHHCHTASLLYTSYNPPAWAGLGCNLSMFPVQFNDSVSSYNAKSLCTCVLQVTSEGYQPVGSSVNGSGFRPFDMIIPFSFRTGEITGEVLMPSGKSAQPLITDNLDGRVTVQYSPTEAGLHEMHIKYNGTHIPESPLQFYVNHASSPNVTAYGPGLSYGVANKVAAFTVYTDDASEGTVATGETGITYQNVKLGSAADFSLDINESDLSVLTASIRAPSGRDEPCLLKRMTNNHIGNKHTKPT